MFSLIDRRHIWLQCHWTMWHSVI